MIARALACACLALVCSPACSDGNSLLQFDLSVRSQQLAGGGNATGSAGGPRVAQPRGATRPRPPNNGANPEIWGKTLSWHSFRLTETQIKTGQAVLVGVVMLIALVLLITELFSPDVVMFVALCICWNAGILTTRDALSGFSNSSLVVVGSMFVVVKGVDRSRLIERTARSTLGSKTSQAVSLLRLSVITLFFGCFINNAPLVALFMPIIRDWARTREFAPSKFLMPLSYCSIGGGVLTLIGTSTNLVINGMLQDDTGESFGFFDPARVGILQNIFTLVYLLTLGIRLLPAEKGGLFRTLKERKPDMVTELQVQPNFPLVGTSVTEVMETIGVPREALLKIFRQPVRKNPARLASPAGTWGLGQLQRCVSDSADAQKRTSSGSFWQGSSTILRYQSSPSMSVRSYMERTAHAWGRVQKRGRSFTDSSPAQDIAQIHARPRAMTIEAMAVPPETEETPKLIPVDDPEIHEIFPVLDHEVVLAGDVLLLSLPRDACVAFVDSASVTKLASTVGGNSNGAAAGASSGPGRGGDGKAGGQMPSLGLRVCDMDLLEIPGRQGEFVELVVSQSNPFVGSDFSEQARASFEEHYQVAILAVRQSNWSTVADETAKADHLLSYANQRKSKRVISRDNIMEEGESAATISRSNSEASQASEDRFHLASAACTGSFPGSPTDARSDAGQGQGGAQARGPRKLRPGDAVLVLAKAGSGAQSFTGQDFLAQTTVANEADFVPTATDYVPLILFIVGIVLVATQQVTMVQVSMALAALYLVFGWVTPKELREGIDWNMLVLIGSALGLAKAVQESGLSGAVASLVKNAQMSRRGTVFVLFFVTMVITELVTNNAAAALAYPLASDISRQMGLSSAKPLAMTVMLATSACYVNPIGTAPNLMVMGPGGYSFRDFMKVGFLMDIICWVNAGIFIPILWPMEFSPNGPPTMESLTPAPEALPQPQ